MAQTNISDIVVILLTNKNTIKDAVRSVLKTLNFNLENLYITENFSECKDRLIENKKSIFILDWTLNFEFSLELLKLIKDKHLNANIYTFIISQLLDDKVIALATEYEVTKVNTGDITKTKIELTIKEIVNQITSLDPIQISLNKAIEARKSSKFKESINILSSLLQNYKDNPRLIVELAESYILANEWKKAMDLLESLKDKEPPYIRALHLYGKCLIKFKKYKQAIEILNKAKIISPYNIDRLLILGGTHLKIGEIDEAKEHFNQALQYSPNNTNAKKALGTALLTEGELNQALSLLKEFTTSRELASIFNSAAILNVRMQNLDKSINLYDTAINIVNDDKITASKLFYNKGIAYFKFNKKDNAIESFQKALALNPSYKNAQHNLNILSNKGGQAQLSLSTKDEDLIFDFEDTELGTFKDDLSQEDEIF